MRQIGEQWIEKDYGGKPHMYKAVSVNDKFDPCIGCCNQGKEEECYNAHSNCGRGVVIIHDLGPVNEDGLLACPLCGKYPTEINSMSVLCSDNSHVVEVFGHGNKQANIDAWNWRAM